MDKLKEYPLFLLLSIAENIIYNISYTLYVINECITFFRYKYLLRIGNKITRRTYYMKNKRHIPEYSDE